MTKNSDFDNPRRLSTRHPYLNSFVPNLVWLPAQVARLTDREGSFVQLYLQALSRKIYRRVPLPPDMKVFTESIWDLLEEPTGIPDSGLPAVEDLNYFEETPEFVKRRTASLRDLLEAVSDLANGKKVQKKLISTRYSDGLKQMRR